MCFFSFPSSLPGGSFFGACFVGVGVGVLLEPCDLSDDDDDDDGDDTASDVCIRFSVISDMKSRNDLQELGLFFEKATLEKIEKYFLRPLDSFTNEWVVSQILVLCINTVYMSVVIYDTFRFILCHTPLLVVSVTSAVWSVEIIFMSLLSWCEGWYSWLTIIFRKPCSWGNIYLSAARSRY